MGDTGRPLRKMTLFQQGVAFKHKLLMRYDELVRQSCRKAHLQSSGRSIMFTNVDLHTVQEYHDCVWRYEEIC